MTGGPPAIVTSATHATRARVELTVEDRPAPAETAALDEQVAVFTSRAARFSRPCPLAVFARDDSGTVVGGVHGWMWGGCYELVSLWVDEPLRNRGLGTSLLIEAERAARLRGCQQVVVLTHHVQAPDLYRRTGYALVGKVTDYPAGGAAYWFRKRLDRRPEAVVRRLVRGVAWGVVWATLGLVGLREAAAAIARRRAHR